MRQRMERAWWSGRAAAGRLADLLATAVRRMRRACRSEPLPCRPLVVLAVCLAAGCAAARIVPAGGTAGPVAWWWLAAGAVAGWAGSRHRPRVAAGWLCLAAVGTGAAWAAARHDLFAARDLAWSLTDAPQPVAIECTVVESPRLLPPPATLPGQAGPRGPVSESVVSVQAVRNGGVWQPAAGRAALVVDGSPPALRIGSRITVMARGLRPAPAFNPGEFDFRARARAKRCLSIVRASSESCLRAIGQPPWWWPPALLDDLRRRGTDVLHAHLSPARGPLAAALLLGSREALPRDEADDFLVTGTVHILSISGLHVGLLALALAACLRMAAVPRRAALVCVAACVGGYMLVVRAETPVVRATLLVWLACLGSLGGRRSAAINALAIAALVILALRPGDVASAGAQLSFLSTATLVGAAALTVRSRPAPDPIERLIDRSRSPAERAARRIGRQAWELFVVGAAVWAVTAPLVAARFHVVSPIGILLNVIVAPLVPLAMALGFACVLAAAVAPPVAAACGAGCDAALAAVSAVVALGARVPGGHAWLAGPPLWWVVGWYGCLVAAAWLLPRPRLARWATWGVVAASWCGVGIGVGLAARGWEARPCGMRVVAAAMGHGCGIVVRSPGGGCLVYDAGRLGAAGAARRAMESVLWSEGIAAIDTLVISHADVDHFNAVPDLLERFAVGRIVVSAAFLGSPAAGVADVRARAAERAIPIEVVQAGDSFAVDPLCRVRVVYAADHDGPAQSQFDDNQASLVLAVESAGRRLLLTGDIEGESLARFVRSDPEACDVLVAPHHGSRTTLPADIAAATTPEWVVVSGPGGRGWPEVQAAYATAPARGATVIRTGGEGAIAITLTADAVRVAQFKAGRWRHVGPTSLPPASSPAQRLAQGIEQRRGQRGRPGSPDGGGQIEHHEGAHEHQERAAHEGEHLPDAERGVDHVLARHADREAGHAVGHAALLERHRRRVFEGRAEEARVSGVLGRDHDGGTFFVARVAQFEGFAGEGSRGDRAPDQRPAGQ